MTLCKQKKERDRSSCSIASISTCVAILFAVCSSSALAIDTQSLIGDYLLTGVSETASAIRLSSDGKYKYFTMIGSLDEMDDGSWKLDGDRVMFTSNGPSNPPSLSFVTSTRTAINGIQVLLEGVDAELAANSMFAQVHAVGKVPDILRPDGSVLASQENPPYEKLSFYFPAALRQGDLIVYVPADSRNNSFTFRVDLGNYGRSLFTGLKIEADGDRLIIRGVSIGQNRDLVYERVKPSGVKSRSP